MILNLVFFFSFIYCQSVNSFEFQKLKTESGIEFWFVEDKSIPIVSLSYSFKGGASLDHDNKAGISNLMTSLMDEGTRNLSASEFKDLMKINGMKMYFSTEKDRIDGVFQIITSQIDDGFSLFYEALNHPRFDEREIEKIKKQIEASIRIDESDIPKIASDKFNHFFFNKHSFSRKVKGTLDSITRISKDDLISFHKEAFTRNNLNIGVAGNVSERQIKKYVEMVFGKLSNAGESRRLETFPPMPSGKEFYKIETPQTTVLFGHSGLSRNDKNFFAIRIANYVLGGGGFQSRLYKNIREKRGLVYSVYSYLLSYQNDGVIIGGFRTRNKSVTETIKRVRDEWKKIERKGITKNELDDAKAYYNGSFTRNFTSTLSIAKLLQIVQYYNLGENYFEERKELIDSLKLDEINNLISEFFKSEELFFMIVGDPEKK
ncbi:MAG: pitrilysin family protein [Pseudomonadota bacterium]|nr:pitrilysin family protein [Pseudomonadota bacterium]